MKRLPFRALVALLPLVGCGNSTGPIVVPNPAEPTEVVLYDFLTGDLLDPSAFDLIFQRAVRTDVEIGWDFVVFTDLEGVPVARPRGGFLNSEEEDDSGIRTMGSSFEGTVEAPETDYVQDGTVALAEGDVFVVRSRRNPSYGTVRCRYYGKFEVLAIDPEAGSITFRHLINPNCERRDLEPGDGS